MGLQAHLMFGEPDWDLLADPIERLGPGQRPLLFDEDLEPKPAFFAVAAVLLANRDR